eukprot:TRINITY_DN11512_c0_g1_i3.p3 TRINITY_DN11512_c0_g1~~TRINITY_DN11512_c0_g1_i3.p3  ORF type:complete len:174 (-),score=19.56 TRINITY_DN11512_c0_g1_i3:450-971(-)
MLRQACTVLRRSTFGARPALDQAYCTGHGTKNVAPFKVTGMNHVAIAVPDLAVAMRLYENVFGVACSTPQTQPAHGVTVSFLQLPNVKLEFLEPLGENSPITKFLERNPSGGIHHICVDVDDIACSLAHVKAHVRSLDKEPKIGSHGFPVAFLHPKDTNGVLLELQQASDRDK